MTESDRNLTIASASQNLDTKKERVVHRLIPMLVAENMTRIAEYEFGESISRVDLWNCVGMRMDKAFKQQNKFNSRRDFSTSLIVDKYTILEELGIPNSGRDIIRDDDDDATRTWFEHKIQELFTSGSIYIDSIGVNICDTCGYLQSIDVSSVDSCSLCDGSCFHQEKRELLMVDIPKDRQSLIEDRIIYPKNTKHIHSFFDQLPPRMMISKVREYGLSLDSIGLEGYVLDPKIGVALMPELVAEKYSLSKLTLTQGAAVATHAIPYTSILTTGFHHTYVLLPKIPITTLDEAREIGIGFIGRYLPLILMTFNGDITPNQLRVAREEYSRIIWKIDNILSLLQSESGQPIHLRPDDNQVLAEVAKDFREYRIRDGQKKLREFLLKTQGKRYAEEMRGKGYYLSTSDINTLEEIIKLYYK